MSIKEAIVPPAPPPPPFGYATDSVKGFYLLKGPTMVMCLKTLHLAALVSFQLKCVKWNQSMAVNLDLYLLVKQRYKLTDKIAKSCFKEHIARLLNNENKTAMFVCLGENPIRTNLMMPLKLDNKRTKLFL